MTTGQPPQPYLQLLEVAYSLGRADGGLAARIEPEDSVAPQSTRCQGREPEGAAEEVAPPQRLVDDAHVMCLQVGQIIVGIELC